MTDFQGERPRMSGRGYSRGFIRFQSTGGSSSGGGASIPPPPSLQVNSRPASNKGFTPLSAIHKSAGTIDPLTALKRRHKTEDEYFNDDDDDSALPYQPAPGSPSAAGGTVSDDEDPLERFMSGIESEVKRQAEAPKIQKSDGTAPKGVRNDIEDLDDEESYYKFVAENPNFGKDEDSDDGLEYDEDGNPIAPKKSKHIDPLPPIDHSAIEYAPFEKNFYEQHPDITNLTINEVEGLRKTLGIKVLNVNIIFFKPCFLIFLALQFNFLLFCIFFKGKWGWLSTAR